MSWEKYFRAYLSGDQNDFSLSVLCSWGGPDMWCHWVGKSFSPKKQTKMGQTEENKCTWLPIPIK